MFSRGYPRSSEARGHEGEVGVEAEMEVQCFRQRRNAAMFSRGYALSLEVEVGMEVEVQVG